MNKYLKIALFFKEKTLLTFCICVVLLMVLMPFLPVRDEGEIYENTLRLHVLANSDSTIDQQLKMHVRDAIVVKTDELADDCKSVDEVKRIYRDNLDVLENVAKDALLENGCFDDVDVLLCEEYYPERDYGEIRLPSGRYTSLQVSIGESEGQNWWCVLYPPLCVDAAGANEELVQTGFTPNQIRLLTDSETPRYVIRFRILEWAMDFAELFKKK